MNKSVEPSRTEVFQRVSRASLLTLGAAVAFGLFFELMTQVLTIRQASPFAVDPFDAIGTLTIQIVCAVGILTFVRSVVLHARGNDSWWRQVLILRGSLVTLTAIVATLIADSIAEFQSSSWGLSAWGTLLVVGLALVTGVTLVAMWTFISDARSLLLGARGWHTLQSLYASDLYPRLPLTAPPDCPAPGVLAACVAVLPSADVCVPVRSWATATIVGIGADSRLAGGSGSKAGRR